MNINTPHLKWIRISKGLVSECHHFPVQIGTTSARQTKIGTAITLDGGKAEALGDNSIAISIDGQEQHAFAGRHGTAISLGGGGVAQTTNNGFALYHNTNFVSGKIAKVRVLHDSFALSTRANSYLIAGNNSVARGGRGSCAKVGQNSRIEIEWRDPVSYQEELRVGYTYPAGSLMHTGAIYLLPYVWYTLDPTTGEFIITHPPNGIPDAP